MKYRFLNSIKARVTFSAGFSMVVTFPEGVTVARPKLEAMGAQVEPLAERLHNNLNLQAIRASNPHLPVSSRTINALGPVEGSPAVLREVVCSLSEVAESREFVLVPR